MKAHTRSLRTALVMALGALAVLPLASCSYDPQLGSPSFCSLLSEGEPDEPKSSDRQIVFEEPGTIIVHHGFTCAESNQPDEERILRVDESVNFPSYVTNATVFLNGWRFRYLSDDHNVAGLGTAIGNIVFDKLTLKWQAAGMMSDDNFDDGYHWCYWYTVIGWNDAVLPLTVDHDDGCIEEGDPTITNLFAADNTKSTTALSCYPSFLINPGFAAGKPAAILPRGFGFVWQSIFERTPDDHHLLQIAYNLEHSEVFAENGKAYRKEDEAFVLPLPNSASNAGSGIVTWETYAIYKDNDARRDYGFGEVVSGMAGTDLGVIQPPFCILPAEDAGFGTGCITDNGALRTEDFVIEQVPFEFAIPVLTGWDLTYQCDDENVKEVGANLDTWSYDRTTGTLRYTLSSVMRDRKNDPAHLINHKVTILGLVPKTITVTPITGPPDLVPFSPRGYFPEAFCNVTAGPQLIVTVKNQGGGHAAASKTTVDFEGVPVTQETPAIPPGGTVDVLFKIPLNCFDPMCTFTIQVDSHNDVAEGAREDNNKAQGVCSN